MPFDYAIVNAFTTSAGPHSGNQAAVVIQSSPRPDSWKALVARDFNFSETAYVEPLSPGRWRLRWFTPAIEAELCGHATLASAAVLFERDPSLTMIEFETRWAGELRAEKVDDGIEIALPTIPQGALNKLEDETVAARQKEEVLEALLKAIPQLKHEEVKQVFKWPWGGEESCIIEIEGSVPLKDLKVEGKAMVSLINRSTDVQLAVSKGMNVVTQTVPSEDGTLHINTRVFVPGAGIDEDPVVSTR